ncbi:MAG: SAM-dependent methyltransferase [Ignavibacteria bacterium]|nr:MAG: SAM-dependent methyltransferase [Ignavibacteria bacterium]KAF0161607.1 MAG: SAM-dependent methyltransferase [Ignavibacteria bacterium]
MSEFWNERFGKEEFLYGKEPNVFLKQELENLKPGKILFPAEGEGRNAVYAATLGWDVDALDSSEAAKVKAEKLAEEKEVKINYALVNLKFHKFQKEKYDAVAIIYFHLPSDCRNDVYKEAIGALKPGGKLILELFDKEQFKVPYAGPKDEDLLYSLEDAVSDFIDLEFEKLAKETIQMDEGNGHQGVGYVIRFVGVKI